MKAIYDFTFEQAAAGQRMGFFRSSPTVAGGAGEAGRRRVAMISTHGYVAADPPLGMADTGGQVVYVLELSKKLAQLGYAVDIWTRRFEDQPAVDVVDANVRVIRVPCGGSGFIPKEYLHQSLGAWVAEARRIIRRERLVYRFINSHYWDAGVAGRALARALDVPHFHTPHSLGIWKKRQMESDFMEDRARLEALYNFSVRNREERRLYGDADLVVATTPVQTDMLVDDYGVPEEKVRMVSPGYDDRRFFPVSECERDSLRRRFGFEGKVVLALGRLARNKGYDLLIRAFGDVVARVPEARLHLAVGGEAVNEREERVLGECRQLVGELGLEPHVRFSGYVPDDDLADMYRAADVFALSSRYEPFGMTAIEAMACGTPVVATTHGGFWRLLRFGVDGLFADSFDAHDFGVTLSKPLMIPSLADGLSQAGAERARQSFTWAKVAGHLLTAVDPRVSGDGQRAAEPASRTGDPGLLPAVG